MVEISTDTPQTQPTLRGRIVLFSLMGLGVMLILAGSMWLLAHWLVIGQGNLTTPATLVDLPKSRIINGRAALDNIERLHGMNILMVDGAVAYYDDGQAVLWISSTWLPSMAARQVEVMTDRIAEGRSPFTPVGTRQAEELIVYELTGLGQTHYYFQLDRQVVWLAISSHLAEQGLGELIRKLQ